MKGLTDSIDPEEGARLCLPLSKLCPSDEPGAGFRLMLLTCFIVVPGAINR
jgi:hypothetical protein